MNITQLSGVFIAQDFINTPASRAFRTGWSYWPKSSPSMPALTRFSRTIINSYTTSMSRARCF